MAGISSPGLSSGLDVQSIVSQLVALERRPIELLQQQRQSTQTKLSSFGLVQSYTTNVRDAAKKLAQGDLWSKTQATSSDASSVAVSASAGAASGNYSIGVSRLAQAQGLASGAYASSSALVGAGTLTIKLGKWNVDANNVPTTFSAGTAAAVQVTVSATDTLKDVRDHINAANAGVTASIVNDASGARLVLRGSSTGENNAVRITNDNASLDALSYDPENATGSMTQTLQALNAQAVVNGLSVSSASNTLSDVVDGLTLTLAKTTSAPVQVNVSADKAAMRTGVDDFVKAYNALNSYLADQTKYDATTKVAGKLQGDSAARSLQSQLRAALRATSGAAAGFPSLSTLGIEVQRDGSLQVDGTKFDSALQNPATAGQAFTADAAGEANDGFGVRLAALTTALTGSDGLLESRTQTLRDSLKRSDDRIALFEDRVARTEQRLLRQYSALDTSLNKLNGLGSYVSQQMAVWSNSSKG